MGTFFPTMFPGSSVPSPQEMGLVSPPGLPCLSLPQAWALLSSLLPQPLPRQIPTPLLLFPSQTACSRAKLPFQVSLKGPGGSLPLSTGTTRSWEGAAEP